MKNTQLAEGNLLAHKMCVELDVFCASVVNRVSRHVDRGDVVALLFGGGQNRRSVHLDPIFV